MEKVEIIEKLVKVHNVIAQIPVSGDGTIAMSTAIVELRKIVSNLQQDVEIEQSEQKTSK